MSATVVPTSVRLPVPVHEALSALAMRRAVPRADLIREAVIECLDMQSVPVDLADNWEAVGASSRARLAMRVVHVHEEWDDEFARRIALRQLAIEARLLAVSEVVVTIR
ncbi:MAG TPA: ribbon-helix-helix protein, CopG family [Streptosporangiaceae bacterium]|nr:ribbon-helix-helix protein, CopG family [Streptosporangiaceae bacterium]